MWEQEEDRLCWWRLCVSTSVCCAHVSGYATHRKQTAAIIHPPPPPTRKQPHTRPTAQEIKSKTHTNMKAHTHTPYRTRAQCTTVFSNVMYTQLRTQTHTLPLHSKQTHSPTHMKNKHSHEIHPHIKTNAQS